MARITINGISIDPLEQQQAEGLAAASLESIDASQSNYILIQTTGPLTPEERGQLVDRGARIHEYVPESTYLCGYEPTDLGPIRDLPFVAWANVYLQGFKIAPSLRADDQEEGVEALLAAAAPDWPADEPQEVDVVLHDDVDPGAVEGAVAEAAQVAPGDVQSGRRKVRVALREGQLDALASIDAVHHIEAVPEWTLHNNVARPLLNADVSVNGTTYQGEGEIVCVADTGFDMGSTTNVHPAFTGRVAKLYALGRPSPPDTTDPHGHGTHVAGSVLGDGSSASMGGAIQGTAPRATLVLQSIMDDNRRLTGIPTDLHDLFEPPYHDDGVRVHTNSWGATVPGLPYGQSARELDDVVWNQPDLVICCSAGNEGIDSDRDGRVDATSVSAKAGAKNCITVGASESLRPTFPLTYGGLRPNSWPVAPLFADRQADNPDGLAAFSSRGPTREQRIKPDVVAPGTSILSALSRTVTNASTTFGTSSDPLWFFDSGTSMATPLVAGCAAVLRETLVRNGTPNPSAALVKALLINGAVELPGQYKPSEAGPSPNMDSGFGRVDLAGSVIIAGPDPNGGFGEGGPLEQGQEESIRVEIPERPPGDDKHGVDAGGSGVTFKVTLVWSDPAHEALQNDLDLIVRTADGQERHGNMGTSDDFDRVNNVEQVLWTDVPPGPAEIVVRCFRITNLPQPYAYAWRIR